MCGIVGWIARAARSLDEGTLRRFNDALSHRGPDGDGVFLAETADGSHQVAFGHRRLSIIDLGGGHQPMTSAEGDVTITFNGEIYNYVELRDELRAKGHGFATASDTEVIVEAYRAWGDACVSRLRGMFAFALFDRRRQRVLLARDPFGKKPLFLADTPGRVAFASEIPALLALPGVDRDLDWASLDACLVDRYVHGPATLFRGIRKLPPGCTAVWAGGELTVARYFTPPVGAAEPNVRSFDEAVRLFAGTFDEAVRLRMRSDAPFGAFLSGGLDSSAVVAAMARHSRSKVKTFSVGFEEESYSELRYARTIAERFATDHAELVITPRDFLDAWPEALAHRAAPVSEMADVPVLLLSRMARGSVKMVLTGEGSDEVLGGYPKHQMERWLGLYQGLVPAALHRAVVAPAASALPYGMRRLKTVAAALEERDERSRMRAWFGGLSRAQRDAVLGRPGEDRLDAFPFSAATPSRLRRTLFFDQTSWLPDNLLERGDRMMMAAGVEGRMPFLDVALVRLAARFPDRFLTGHPKGKAVLRAAVRPDLPAEILDRKKVGFRIPMNEWMRGPARDRLLDCLASGQSETRRLFEAAELDRLVGQHLEGRHNHEKVLWSLMNVELFLRTFRPGLGGAAEKEPVPRMVAAQ